MHEAVQEIQDILSGRPGGVNRFLRRWGKLVIDYSTALIPDREAPFDKLIEDIFVDAVSQCRAAARATTEEQVQAFLVESALRTVRSRYRELLETKATPSKATSSLTFQEVIDRSNETTETLHEAISSGRIRAVRDGNEMRVDPENIPELKSQRAALAYHVSAAERELLCLHFRLKYSPDEIAQWSDRSAVSLESLINTASEHLSQRIEAKSNQSAAPEDAEMRRYIEGRLSTTDTARFEQKVLKDKVAQERINTLRSETDHIRDLFKASAFDLSRIAVNVRDRNPHRTLIIPPSVALWVQVAALVAIVLVLHSVGAYIAPPSVEVHGVTGEVRVDGDHALASLHDGKLVVGQSLTTGAGAQALVVLDDANSIRMAESTNIKLREPRKSTRQVVDISEGEIWGKFVGSGYAFSVGFEADEETRFELTSDQGAEFDLAVGEMAQQVLPDNLPTDQNSSPAAVLRVFRGVVLTGQVDTKYQPVGRDQWIVFFNDGNSFTGRRGAEDFRLLRFEAGNRYKDRLHWLNTKNYPLQGQNSLLGVDRKLRELASALEDYRTAEVVREGATEITKFREQIEKVIADAESRVAAGNGRGRTLELSSLSDTELIAAREQILGDISFWLKQASSGAYPTLGDAAKTMIHPINKDKERMTALDDRIGDAAIRQAAIAEIDVVIEGITDAIANLKKDKLTDADGTKRAELQVQIDAEDVKVLAGREADGRTEILKVRLNDYDEKIDNKRRQLPPLRIEESALQTEVSTLERAIADNRYTPELLSSTQLELNTANEKLEAETIALESAKEALTAQQAVLAAATKTRVEAQTELDKSKVESETAATAFVTAEASQQAAKKASDDANAALETLQTELDALPENDTRRAELAKDVAKAKQVATENADTLAKAEIDLKSAATDKTNGESIVKNSSIVVDNASKAEALAKLDADSAKATHDNATANLAKTRNTISTLETELKDLDALKVKLASDNASLAAKQTALVEKQRAIKTLETDAEALETKAAPHREKLKAEQATVDAGKKAAKAKDKIQAEKDRYDAHSEDLARRDVQLKKEQEKRKQLADSELIRNYDQIVEDFNTLARRVDAMEWLRHRALAEDVAFGHKQVAARDLFKELVVESETKAVTLLGPVCAPYQDFKLSDEEADAEIKRSKLLSTLWRLYYSSEELADSTGITCYYVAVQSGANIETFDAIDLKWREALSLVLGEKKFEAAANLTSTNLQTVTETKE
ncbi:hypothetical protein OAU50_04905 [Planctomycetota bacterium]|nr:hypothetical protein [Planctomycetota bacterium]